MKTLVTLLLACCFGSAMAQSNLPACRFWVVSQWTNCLGSQSFANGNKYVGEYKDGKFNGQGRYTWPDGEEYVGEFKDDMYNGQGRYSFANGDKYVGEYKDDRRNGRFTVTYANGDKYVGEYKDDKKSGEGIYTAADGNKYVGEFRNDKRNGQGITFLSNGKLDKSGVWKENELTQSKLIDVTTFTKIQNLLDGTSVLSHPRATEELAKQAEFEAQRKACLLYTSDAADE